MYKLEVDGDGCIKVRVVADSVSSRGDHTRITTMELEYPRFIHSEFMTHRMFSRNAMSSRAIPITKMAEQVKDNPARPIHWGKNQKGMQADEVLSGVDLAEVSGEWNWAAKNAAESALHMHENNSHKQIANRVLEPFQVMKTIVTATEWKNFFHLRNHPDAQPEIRELAKTMWVAMEMSEPEMLFDGEWHTPYVDHFHKDGYLSYRVGGDELTLDSALKVSASCCAQVSFRLQDNSVEKAISIYDRLVNSKPVHASPFEHQAKPMVFPNDSVVRAFSEEGTTHIDRSGDYWSGNFKGWIQHRQLIRDHVVEG